MRRQRKTGLCGEALHPMGWRSKSDAFLPAWNLKMHKGISYPDYGKPHVGAKGEAGKKMRRSALGHMARHRLSAGQVWHRKLQRGSWFLSKNAVK
jgi:hypothetical protein